MEFVLSNLERFGGVLVGSGVLFLLIAVIWLFIAAMRGAKARGPMTLLLLGGLLAALPFSVNLLHQRALDLSQTVRFLNSDMRIGIREAGNLQEENLHFKARAAIVLTGIALGFAGFFWLLIAAFRQWSRVKWPVLLFLLGACLVALPFGANRLLQRYIDFGPRERVVDGELHITLTGWDRNDYSILRFRPQTIVLQMANPDVSDATLEYLEDMTRLRELDLNDTQVTDDGLVHLQGLPLESLRLARTNITDAGFRKHLLPRESIVRLELTGTEVSPATVREWRSSNPKRRALR